MRCKPAGYQVIRLNAQTDTGWAVIEKPSGAIAVNADGRLLMRLGKSEAAGIAAAMAHALLQASAGSGPIPTSEDAG